jgi:hypothetical protein
MDGKHRVMKMRIFAILALMLAALPAYAQTMTGTLTFNATPAYQGVGDIDTGVAHYWGLTAYSHAVAVGGTQAGVDLSNNSTTCTGVKFLSTGALDVSSGLYCASGTQTVTTWCSTNCVYNGSAHIMNLYDQVGSANQAPAAYASAPVFILSGFNAKPTGQCGGGTGLNMTATIASVSLPLSFSMTYEQFAGFTTPETFESGAGGMFASNNSAANTLAIAATGSATALTATAANATGTSDFAHGHSFMVTVNAGGTTQSLFLDGAQVSGSPATISFGNATGTTWYLCSNGGFSFPDIYFGRAWVDNTAATTTIANSVTNLTTFPLP